MPVRPPLCVFISSVLLLHIAAADPLVLVKVEASLGTRASPGFSGGVAGVSQAWGNAHGLETREFLVCKQEGDCTSQGYIDFGLSVFYKPCNVVFRIILRAFVVVLGWMRKGSLCLGWIRIVLL